MENIKITYIPSNNLKTNEGFLKSISDLSFEDTELINPYILYDPSVDISIENSDSLLFKYTYYISQDTLYDEIKNICLTEDESVIIIYGYDLTLDEIREKICPILKNNPDILLSINLISDDKELKSNTSIYLDSNCIDYSDEEWESIKKDFEKYYTKNKNKHSDGIELVVSTGDSVDIMYDFLRKLANIPEPIIEEKEQDLKLLEEDNYVSYTYEDFNNYVSINKVKDLITIEDEDGNKILFDNKALDFIIEILNKFKLN